VINKCVPQQRHSGLWRVRELEKLHVRGRDGPILDQRLEIYDFLPELRAVQDDHDLLRQLLGLHQRQDLEKLVHRSESARKDHQRLRQISEPELAHEEVMELEIQFIRDIRIRVLLVRKTDVQSDGLASRIRSPAIGRLHDSRTAAGADHEAVCAIPQRFGPVRYQSGKRPRVVIVLRQRSFFANAR